MKPRSMWRSTILFLFIWLMVGFFSGTAVLLGPVRWITEHGRNSGWSDTKEKVVVLTVIAAYVLLSALVAWLLTRTAAHSRTGHVRLGIPTLAFAAAAACLWLWMNPATLGADMGEVNQVNARFTFGPYPDEDRMRLLKQDGFTGVITLLHPAVVPFEPKLIADEKAAAAVVGIEIIEAPMLPWVSENQESLDKILELARSGRGRFYVHCFLGKDRVNTVRALVEREVGNVEVENQVAGRSLEEQGTLERGDVHVLGEGVILTPYPTDEEYMGFVLTGNWASIVSLMDPEHEGDRKWIDKEREVLERYRIPFHVVPLAHGDWDPQRGLQAAEAVWKLPRPVLVHSFLGPSTGKSPAAEGFMQSFLTGLPALPPASFKPPMYSGATTLLAPNVAIGPAPSGGEFRSYLFARGVRTVLFISGNGASGPDVHRKAAEAAGLDYETVDLSDTAWIDRLAAGGPYYIYGRLVPGLEAEIARRFGPPVPDAPRWDGPESKPEPDPASAQDPEEEDESAAADPGFMERLLPTTREAVLTAPLLLLYAAFAGGFAGWLRTKVQVRAPYTRKIFHFLIFTTAGILHLAGGLPLVALFGGLTALVVLYAVWRGDNFPFYEAMARLTDAPRRSLFILVPLGTTAAGGLLSNLMFGPFAVVGYLVGGWGDAIGEPVGTAFGKHRYKVPSLGGVAATRSFEGSAAVLAMGVGAACLALWLGGYGAGTILMVGLACGVAGALVEAVSNHGLDNLTIQIAAAGTAWLLLG